MTIRAGDGPLLGAHLVVGDMPQLALGMASLPDSFFRAWAIAIRQIAPWCAGSQHPADAVEDTSIVRTKHASRLVRQHRPDGRPFIIREFVAHDSKLQDAIYLNVTPSKNGGTTIYKLEVKDVPVDGFWSISLYNAEGYLEANNLNAYTLNNITANKSDDGSVAVQFGGRDGKISNLPADHERLELRGAALSAARPKS